MPDYKIVQSHNSYDRTSAVKNLETKVNILLKEGYLCKGGIVVVFDKEGALESVYQTMVKYD